MKVNSRYLVNFVYIVIAVFIFKTSLPAYQEPKVQGLSQDVQVALDNISADSMRGHLSFIASDLLAGRDTPSQGLDIAAEYIAAQFRRASLTPVGDDGYFQTADFFSAENVTEGSFCTLQTDATTVKVNGSSIYSFSLSAIEVLDKPIFKIDLASLSALSPLKPEQVKDKIVLVEFPSSKPANADEEKQYTQLYRTFDSVVQPNASLIIYINGKVSNFSGAKRLINVKESKDPNEVSLSDPELEKVYKTLKPGINEVKFSLKTVAPNKKPIKLRNVIGVLPGSDPVLKDTYVLVTAHYDHIGEKANCGTPDCIYNGANDDGSGTVSVIELASALSKLKTRPKRSIVFMTFFGEEKGGFGSNYYIQHPIFPIGKTIADINLEQVGRTDSNDGPQLSNASLTGYDYSDLSKTLELAGKELGVKIYKDEKRSDPFFFRSDNYFLAEQGIPAHSFTVAFEYPDYHGVGDHWQKVDYENMQKVMRVVGLSLYRLAESEKDVQWNANNPDTVDFIKAYKAHHPENK